MYECKQVPVGTKVSVDDTFVPTGTYSMLKLLNDFKTG